ncbi:hypothetical protein G9A89_001233 [Geosiphon pyriformis]|nr:hypothetical protein G9A89_001233 [Geosiphon pyriformis]
MHQEKKWVSPNIKLPYGVRGGAAGVRNNVIFYLVYNGQAGYPPVSVFPVDIATAKYFLYWNEPEICHNTLDTLQVFNMTFRNLTQEHKIVTNIPSNDFKLPKINNLDMNAENDEADPNIRNQEIGISGEPSNQDQVSSKSRLPT